MHLLVTLRIAARALRKNKMRAALTILGVVIGIAAVTTMVSIGQSANGLVQGQFQALGTNVIVIFSASRRGGAVHQGRGSSPTLTAADSDAMPVECPSVLAASPIVGAGGQVIYGNTNWPPREMVGVGTDYLTVRNWQLRHGGFFTERDITSAAKVCVIGHTIVEKLFQTTNPLGETIRINNIPFRIIGILETKGANLVGEDQDNIVMAPYTTVKKRLRGSTFDNVDVILASARSSHRMTDAENEIRQLLYERHRIPPGEPADFEVQNTTEIANVLGIITGTMTLLSGLDRRHLAGGRRRRDHEHHARLGHRADPRDRHPPGRRRPGTRHPPAVSHRIGPAFEHRRPDRRRAGHRRFGGSHGDHQRADEGHPVAGGDLVQGRRRRHALCRRRRRFLRFLPRPARQPPRSDRRAAV